MSKSVEAKARAHITNLLETAKGAETDREDLFRVGMIIDSLRRDMETASKQGLMDLVADINSSISQVFAQLGREQIENATTFECRPPTSFNGLHSALCN